MRIRNKSIMGLQIDPNPILQTNIMRIIWQTVRRITNEIMGVKGLMSVSNCAPTPPLT